MWALTVATAVQFVILLGLAVVVLSLARQVGILHERLSPAGMTRARQGIEPGDALPGDLALEALDGEAVDLGTGASAVLFVAADCPICKSVLPAFEGALAETGRAPYWVADGLPGKDGALPDYGAYADDHHIDRGRFIVSQELGLTLGIRQLPALALFGTDGRLEEHQALSGPRQIEALLKTAPQAATP